MSQLPADASFLQHLYGQDTLYLVPEEKPLVGLPVPPTVAVIEKDTPVSADVTANEKTDVEATDRLDLDTEGEKATPAIQWMGQAVKGTYLLFEVTTEVFQQLPQHVFLKKVLAAVGLETLEVRFGNLSPALVHNVKEIAREQQARHILVFGDNLPIENLLKLEPYRMYKLDETRFVRVDSLAAIEQSNELKKKLWDVLQKIFLQ